MVCPETQTMSNPILLVALIYSGQLGSVSTDELEEYTDQIVMARQACGPTAVCYCLRRFGNTTTLSEVWRQAKINEKGASLEELLDLFSSYNISARALAGDASGLDDLAVPSILIVNDVHCVVFEGLVDGGQTVRFFEPAEGKIRTISRPAMERQWSGEVIVFTRPALSHHGFWALVALIAL